jgi:AmmeMemoRadiSam system protein A
MGLIDPPTRRRLLTLARAALEARVRGGARPGIPPDLDVQAYGVFVTIHCGDALRGCLGALEPRDAIPEAIVRLAAAVAHEDYRFTPLQSDELASVMIDLSILTPPEIITAVERITVGRHGLIVQHGAQRGLLLPQVAPEQGWDANTFLEHTCLKAGLARDAWRDGATISCFEAEVFGERLT